MKIREQKRKMYKDKILSAAREVFSENGFENTTIEQIAERAGVGMGTTYNYFKSKEALFIMSTAEEIMAIPPSGFDNDDSDNSDATEIVSKNILKPLKKIKFIDKKIWQIAYPILFNTLKSGKIKITELFKADYKMMDDVARLLNELIAKQKLPHDLDIDTAVEVIFGALFFQMTLYIYMDDYTFEQMCDKVTEDINFILGGKNIAKQIT